MTKSQLSDKRINEIKQKLKDEYNASEIFADDHIVDIIKQFNGDYEK